MIYTNNSFEKFHVGIFIDELIPVYQNSVKNAE